MSLPTRHIIHQGGVIASLGQTALQAALQKWRKRDAAPLAVPGPEISTTMAARPSDLIRDYVRHVGGDPSAYRATVPAHMFPQWGFPLAVKTLRGIPYPMMRVLNGGCRIDIAEPLPAGAALHVTAQLESIDDNGRRAVLTQRVTTGTAEVPDAITARLYAVVPLPRDRDKDSNAPRPKKQPALVPEDAREIAYWHLPANAGLAFAMLTGDFNPVHWVPPYARASGFRNTILHGFSTMARAIEGLNRAVFAGDVNRLRSIDVKFTKPLVLPARVGLYLRENDIYVGAAPGAAANLTGTFSTFSGDAS